MYRTSTYLSAVFALILCAANVHASEPVAKERILAAIRASQPYLEKEGRVWFNGENEYQEEGCVSCHQVPSGVWSLASSARALETEPTAEFRNLLGDALEHVADPKTGRPAMWSQLLITSKLEDPTGPQTVTYRKKYLPEILKAQQEDGRWRAQGQFPSQRRPIAESDAVITMWMLSALDGETGEEVETARNRAQEFLKSIDGKSSEWLAWSSLLFPNKEVFQRIVASQNEDGGWGWSDTEPSNAFSTGIVLFALKQSPDFPKDICNAAIGYLVETQSDDGTWAVPSQLITKKGSDSLDYVYRYWSTAWAIIGLSQKQAYAAES